MTIEDVMLEFKDASLRELAEIIRDLRAGVERYKAKLATSELECLEQARLLGAGGSREAALMAQLAKSEAARGRLVQTLELILATNARSNMIKYAKDALAADAKEGAS